MLFVIAYFERTGYHCNKLTKICLKIRLNLTLIKQ